MRRVQPRSHGAEPLNRPTLLRTAAKPTDQQASRLAEFIESNREPILAEWEAFARTCGPASVAMGIDALRDHASEMLTVIVADLLTPETGHEQKEKSKGNAIDPEPNTKTAAQQHGTERAESGFTVDQMVSEYRALRASVIRLWTESKGAISAEDIDDLTRFNEAIDQALAESVARYTQDLAGSKDMFLAILGHDLRSPLSAIITSAMFMLDTHELNEPHLTLTSRIASSATRMNRLIGDLLDFTRTRLGDGIPIVRAEMSMEKLVRDVVDEVSAANPKMTIQVSTVGPERGEWDCARISQVVTNMLGNAVEHGSNRTAVTVNLRGDENEVRIAIHNHGAVISAEERTGLFDPMKREGGRFGAALGPSGHLGLGLYIAHQIVHAHGGTIEIRSTAESGTTFTIHLPRRGPSKP
ncbi:MAG: sensor histidine kinase [Gemmatimonadota bacterium]|nr:sensor histidine kinase [Gemmatimonadota bacterium]